MLLIIFSCPKEVIAYKIAKNKERCVFFTFIIYKVGLYYLTVDTITATITKADTRSLYTYFLPKKQKK